MKRAQRLALLITVGCPYLIVSGFADSVWGGYVTDTHCGTHCQRTSDMKPDLHCIQECVRKGSKYGLWSGKHVYPLQPQSQAASYEAQNVEVRGELRNGTIYISSISESKSH